MLDDIKGPGFKPGSFLFGRVQEFVMPVDLTKTKAAVVRSETPADQHVVRLVCAALAIAMGTLAMRIAGLW